jgi:isopenicillin-N epimerase
MSDAMIDDGLWERWHSQWDLGSAEAAQKLGQAPVDQGESAGYLAVRPEPVPFLRSSGVTYLNHGSFGPPPRPVQEARRQWQHRLDSQPMDFFMRNYEPAWLAARQRLAEFINADPHDLVFVENATVAMNVVAASLGLAADDQVLLTDHEYGAVQRIWRRATAAISAPEPCVARLPDRIEAAEQVVEAIFSAAGPRTRLVVVSHITSPTAITLPIEAIVREAHRRGIWVCVDGPHAPAQLPLDLAGLGCDFYCASLHKWLSAPFGSGFLYVRPEHQSRIVPPQLSWGRLLPNRPEVWSDEFVWSGTRDPSAMLAVPAAIDFLRQVGEEPFRQHGYELATYARARLAELTGLTPITPDDRQWYTCMAHAPLPPGDAVGLQRDLWQRYAIEVPIVSWNNRRWIRVSCHLYNRSADIDRLIAALEQLL